VIIQNVIMTVFLFASSSSWYDLESMVTYEQLREHLGHKPFRPLRIMLEGGRQLDVTRPNQVVAMKKRLYAGSGKDVPFWIWLEQIESVELIDAQPA
jgi:hypothetical protein